MRLRSLKLIYLILLTSLLTSALFSQNITKFKWPENKITPIFIEFVEAYNTNDLKKLEAFTTKNYEKDFVKNATYWPSVFADFGEIEAFRVSKKWTNKNRLAIWFQGKHTKGWVMIMLRMNKDNTKIIGKGVMRGEKPSGNLPSYNHISSKEMIPYFKKYIGQLHKLDRFSGSVLIAKGNTILFEETYGESNKKLGAKNNVNTSFNIASTTKTFTAIAIAKLAEQGILKFTDPISKLIPEYPKDIANQVTIHHLLTHTSGIELDDYKPFNEDVKKAKSMDDLLKAQIKHIDSLNEDRRKDFKVLNRFDYSNENFSLLGLIIERASGVSYAEYIEKNIFEPLKMKNSFADLHKLTSHQNIAIGYTYKNTQDEFIGGIRRENDKMGGIFLSPAGGIYSTTRDLYTYFKAINNHSIITKRTHKILHKKHTKIYGYGFYLSDNGIGHGGVYPGVGSVFTHHPGTDYYVIILSNYGSMAGSVISNHIHDLLESNN
ncbi:serine hydrolase domain-containing protein [uncultured Tenacibaculum sp.]|uniref:serine hydrolase domain-containing protein n=1 Tax=uncultured Tenacibaculum sp. TaxID=174713 RepID=UPI0026128E12|nr:serine hydrolase domain-containing protein [uncultured Tenacibaculum sp.]